jgi:hypothetical protein
MAKKYTHVMSINLAITTNSEERPSNEEVQKALDEFLKENKEALSEGLEWVDTEEE